MRITVSDTLQHVLFHTRRFDRDDIESVILTILMDLHVATDHNGFEYLRIAILLNYQHPTGSMSKDVYPVVANYYDVYTGAQQVEQAIRSAIISAWRNREDEIWLYYFPTDKAGKIRKPTNAEFITKIARVIELWHRCKEEVVYATE